MEWKIKTWCCNVFVVVQIGFKIFGVKKKKYRSETGIETKVLNRFKLIFQ